MALFLNKKQYKNAIYIMYIFIITKFNPNTPPTHTHPHTQFKTHDWKVKNETILFDKEIIELAFYNSKSHLTLLIKDTK